MGGSGSPETPRRAPRSLNYRRSRAIRQYGHVAWNVLMTPGCIGQSWVEPAAAGAVAAGAVGAAAAGASSSPGQVVVVRTGPDPGPLAIPDRPALARDPAGDVSQA